MAITDKEKGVWGLDQVYNKINQGSIWEYSNSSNLMAWGRGTTGELGQNDKTNRSSPVQIPGTWDVSDGNSNTSRKGNRQEGYSQFIKGDGTLWSWGYNTYGMLGQNNRTQYSSPVQVGSGTDWKVVSGNGVNSKASSAIKTDGTLYTWGYNDVGQLGLNSPGPSNTSSPTQIPGTTWSQVITGGEVSSAIKTDGTLWIWGRNHQGMLGLNDLANRSSPIQIPGTTWIEIAGGYRQMAALKSDGTLWVWGSNYEGALGLNQTHSVHPSYANCVSSPTQLPGTTWRSIKSGNSFFGATKTDGTAWAWGTNGNGQLGQNSNIRYSSPVQVPGTDWNIHDAGNDHQYLIKNAGTLWGIGQNTYGELDNNNRTNRSSPTQVPGTWQNAVAGYTAFAWPS